MKEKPHSNVWMVGPDNNQVMSIHSEGIARGQAPLRPETIYFFAELGETED